MARSRMAVLVNAKSTRCPEDVEALVEPLRARHEVRIVRVEDPTTFSEQIEAAARDSDLLVIGSGDGTLARSGEALIESGCVIGVLPFGNANDLARGLGMPLDVEAACHALVDAEPRPIDVGVVNGHCFFNAAIIGVGAAISSGMDAATKRRWKRLSQIPNMLNALFSRRAFSVSLYRDDQTERMRSIHFTVANGRTIGGGIVVDEDARLDDGRFDISSVRPLGLVGLLMLAPAMAMGRRRHHPQVDFEVGADLRVETSRRLEIATDGDVVTETPAVFECRPGAVRFLVPQRPEATVALDLGPIPALGAER